MEDVQDSSGHLPVMAEEVMAGLAPGPGMVALDCTAGRGGHAELLAKAIAPGGRLIALDVDPANVEYCRQRLAGLGVRVDVVRSNFARAKTVLGELGLAGVDVAMADLGFASTQMNDPARGFSFNEDGPLDMRLDPSLPHSAADLVASLSERELASVLYEFGEERLSRRIARKIVEIRAQMPIETTLGLARIVQTCYPSGPRQRIHPATRTFMALRIAVNQELAALERLLGDLPGILLASGRAGIISFHSLEDRRVKQAFTALERTGDWKRVTGKPQTATEQERDSNPRSRSAKLRIIERLRRSGQPD
ncbi:MAG: 16S rRNA (cytosine(1402)-N(4))-methyltransferase RsmH [Phycisphaeraceae bacterium]|nr:16S rRNA (cytosine(1402)-N(4))-methyltransferase RsmH [Phycisphaeraceae bacterium]